MTAAFTATREALLPAIAAAQRAVARANTIPILGNMLVAASSDAVSLSGTDLDCEIATAAPAKVGAEGVFTVPGAKLHDIVRKLPEKAEISVSASKDACDIASGRARFRLPVLPASDFPTMAAGDLPISFSLPGEELASMLATVSFAISKEETRYYLNGVHWHADDGHLIAVATDGHRLARWRAPLPDGASGLPAVIVPRRTVDLVKGMLGGEAVEVALSQTMIRFAAAGVTLLSKMVDGTFPDYRRVIPTANDRTFTVERAAMIAAIERVSTITTERGGAVKFGFAADGATLDTINPDAGSASDFVSGEGGGLSEPLTVGFNGRYALDVLGATDAKQVTFRLGDPGSPVIVEPVAAEPRPLFVVMPMRV